MNLLNIGISPGSIGPIINIFGLHDRIWPPVLPDQTALDAADLSVLNRLIHFGKPTIIFVNVFVSPAPIRRIVNNVALRCILRFC